MLCVLKKAEKSMLEKDVYYGDIYTWFDDKALRRTDDIYRAQFYDLEDAEKCSENGIYEVVTLTDADAEDLKKYYEMKIEEYKKQLEDIERILGKDKTCISF